MWDFSVGASGLLADILVAMPVHEKWPSISTTFQVHRVCWH
jgi:hypothetical protein